jgi:hypothetical protein
MGAGKAQQGSQSRRAVSYLVGLLCLLLVWTHGRSQLEQDRRRQISALKQCCEGVEAVQRQGDIEVSCNDDGWAFASPWKAREPQPQAVAFKFVVVTAAALFLPSRALLFGLSSRATANNINSQTKQSWRPAAASH